MSVGAPAYMRARQAEEQVQGVWGRRHMRARQGEAQVQGVRGYQGWLSDSDSAALGASAGPGLRDPLQHPIQVASGVLLAVLGRVGRGPGRDH